MKRSLLAISLITAGLMTLGGDIPSSNPITVTWEYCCPSDIKGFVLQAFLPGCGPDIIAQEWKINDPSATTYTITDFCDIHHLTYYKFYMKAIGINGLVSEPSNTVDYTNHCA